MTIYDRPFKLPVIVDVSKLSEEDKTKVFQTLSEHKPSVLSYPSEHAIDVAKDLAMKGWPSLAKKLPLNVSPMECEQIFAQSLKRFNAHAYIMKKPNTSIINKHIETTADFENIVDELLGQQDDVSVSQVFSTADRKTSVFLTNRTTPVNSRLSDNVIGVAKLGDTDKAVETRLKGIAKQVSKALEAAQENERVTFKDDFSGNFRYK